VSAAPGLRAAVLAGMGFAIAPEWMFAPELASGAVRPVLTDWTLPAVDLWAVHPTGRIASAKTRAFVAFIEAQLNGPHNGGSVIPGRNDAYEMGAPARINVLI
jgi:DNA-binding transcriptional LysR family regulator